MLIYVYMCFDVDKKKLKKLIKKNKVKEKIQLSEEIMIIASNV